MGFRQTGPDTAEIYCNTCKTVVRKATRDEFYRDVMTAVRYECPVCTGPAKGNA